MRHQGLLAERRVRPPAVEHRQEPKDIIGIGDGIDASRGYGLSGNPEEASDGNRRLAIAVAVGCALIGLALRYLARERATIDAVQYLIPWYVFARDHGVGALSEAFTNYTPLYSYLLLIA